jgi:hypothetical protein
MCVCSYFLSFMMTPAKRGLGIPKLSDLSHLSVVIMLLSGSASVSFQTLI